MALVLGTGTGFFQRSIVCTVIAMSKRLGQVFQAPGRNIQSILSWGLYWVKYNIVHRWNCSRYFVAASTPSSSFSGSVPLPTLVAPLPPAAPPTTPETAFAHSLALRPCFEAPYKKGQ